MTTFDATPPPIALEPLLAFPIRDPGTAGGSQPRPGINSQPVYLVGGYRSLIFALDMTMNPGPPAPVEFGFSQGWPADSLPSRSNAVRPVWGYGGVVTPIAFRYLVTCRIPVVAPLFVWSFGPTTGTSGEVWASATIHGTDLACQMVTPLDLPYGLATPYSGGELLKNSTIAIATGQVVPAGGVFTLDGARRWWAGRAQWSIFASTVGNWMLYGANTAGTINTFATPMVTAADPINAWHQGIVEIPGDTQTLNISGPPGGVFYFALQGVPNP